MIKNLFYPKIPPASTHKIYTKSIFLVPHKPCSTLLLHCGAYTQCFKWELHVFIYRNFWVVLSPTFGTQPCAALSAEHILLGLNYASFEVLSPFFRSSAMHRLKC